jgi:hypothetical protein
METVLEEYTTENRISVFRFLLENDSLQRILIKIFLFYGGKYLSRKAVHTWVTNASLMGKKNGSLEVAERTSQKTSMLRVSKHW